MASYWLGQSGRTSRMLLAVLAFLCCAGIVAAAQEQPAPKVELFGGYSYLNSGAEIHGLLADGVLPVSACLCSLPRGAGGSITYDFNSWIGLTGDFSGNWSSGGGSTVSTQLDQFSFYSLAAGPKLTYRTHHFSPFVEGLAGEQRLAPELFHSDQSFGFLAGGGIDLNVGKHFAIRLGRADFVFSNHQFGPSSTVPATDVRGLRLETGVVFLFGGRPPQHGAQPAPMAAPLAAPAAAPVEAMPVIAAAQPPTLTCSAMPSSVMPGASSTITAIGTSPQNHPLNYNYGSNSGVIQGTGTTAILSTAGVSPGMISVTCNVIDDRGLAAAQTVLVTVLSPAIAVKPMSTDLCSLSFDRDVRRPARVNNEAKACLDEVALSLQQDSGAQLAVVGNAASQERANKRLAAERAVNTKAYLVKEKGVDASRITVYTGNQDSKTVSNTLSPAGATWDSSGSTPVDETRVRARAR